MAIFRCDFSSPALGMQTSAQLVMPDDAQPAKLKLVYLLHGLSDNCTGWQRFVPVELYAREYNVAFIMPEVQRSFYQDMAYGLKYFTYIHKELPKFCERIFGFSKARESNYVFGLSMGGYGALRCALSQPFYYAGAAAFSSVANIKAFPKHMPKEFENEWVAISGKKPLDDTQSDIFKLIKDAVSLKNAPELYVACGKQDFLISMNRELSQELANSDINYTYEEWDGEHTWRFWNQALEKACIKFFGK